MAIQLVGAGLGRTGTHSLKLAIERLLGGTCHHMMEVTEEQGPLWNDAFTGGTVDWPGLLGDYCSDWDRPDAIKAFKSVEAAASRVTRSGEGRSRIGPNGPRG